jgi:hypothetical protein
VIENLTCYYRMSRASSNDNVADGASSRLGLGQGAMKRRIHEQLNHNRKRGGESSSGSDLSRESSMGRISFSSAGVRTEYPVQTWEQNWEQNQPVIERGRTPHRSIGKVINLNSPPPYIPRRRQRSEDDIESGRESKRRRSLSRVASTPPISESEPELDDGKAILDDDDDIIDDEKIGEAASDGNHDADINTHSPPSYAYDTDHSLHNVVIIPQLSALICTFCEFVVGAKYLQRHFKERKDHPAIPIETLRNVFKEFKINENASLPDPPTPGCQPIFGLKLVEAIDCSKCGKEFTVGTPSYNGHRCGPLFSTKFFFNTWTHQIKLRVIPKIEKVDDNQRTAAEWMMEEMRRVLKEDGEKNVATINRNNPHPFFRRLGFNSNIADITAKQLQELKEAAGFTSSKKSQKQDKPLLILCRTTLQSLHAKLQNGTFFAVCAALTTDDLLSTLTPKLL